MLVRITGLLTEVDEGWVVLERDGLAYEVLVPQFALGELAARRGQNVTLHTIDYLEGNPAGGNLAPRLIGFLHAADREFFETFTTVKGVGVRKGLRALCEPTARIARDIEAADAKGLARLPGIGARLAQQIIAELRGKLSPFVHGPTGGPAVPELDQAQRVAADMMVSWGDSRADVERWIRQAAQSGPPPETAEEWVRAAYRVRSA